MFLEATFTMKNRRIWLNLNFSMIYRDLEKNEAKFYLGTSCNIFHRRGDLLFEKAGMVKMYKLDYKFL